MVVCAGAEKGPLPANPKKIEPGPLFVLPHTPSGPSRRRVLVVRLFHILVALSFVYSLHFWYSGRLKSTPKLSESDYLWPISAFNCPHKHHGKDGILNGERAERIFLEVPDEESAIAASRTYATLPHLAGSDQDFATAKYFLDFFQENFGIKPPRPMPVFAAGTSESREATLSIPHTSEPRAWIDTYYPLLNMPLDHSLQILDDQGDIVWSADLEEEADPLDGDAAKAQTAVPIFHGLSKGGDVTGELFYANYGRQEDYDEVEKSGTNITGKIALVRYGVIFRGLKVKGAQERGAIGTLIYSDPKDDGSVTVKNGYEPYPHGPARNPTSVQRGSVQFISAYPGDPTTPGYPAYENSIRIEGTNIPSIPSLPLSWNTAQVLLHEISNDGQGRRVRLVNNVDNKITPIWNTMGVIPGHIKNEVVVLGNHRDAWVLGAADPSSGTSSVHEVVRGLGVLYRSGWRPLRTILIANWDAEEYGLIGSTEWGEDFPVWISEHVVAYINVDVGVTGSKFRMSGSPLLAHLLKQAALDTPHPTRDNLTLWDATSDRGELFGPADSNVVAMADAEEQGTRSGLSVAPLGSGSDYTVFLQRIGVASSDGGFGTTLRDPVYHYHSIYDSQRFQELFADPGFHRHVAVSKFLGLVTLRLADSIVLPLNTTYYTEELASYVYKVEGIANDSQLDLDLTSLREAIGKLHNASLAFDVGKVAAEKKLRRILKKWQRHRGHGHQHNHHKHRCTSRWRRISRWIKNVFGVTDAQRSGDSGSEESLPPRRRAHDDHIPPRGPGDDHPHHLSHNPQEPAPGPYYPRYPPHHPWHPHPLPPHRQPRHPSKKLIKAVKRVQRVNKKLAGFERGFISKEGIVDREWYKHLVVAPGKWLGYGATTLPALTEALTIEKNSTLAKHEAERLTILVTKLTEFLAV